MKIMFTLLMLIFVNSFVSAKEIVMGVGALPVTDELPHVRSTNKTQVLRQIYDSLFYVNDNGNIQSTFFSEWKISIPNKRITFKLIDGIRFSDGTPITSTELTKIFKRTFEDGKPILAELKNIQVKGNRVIEIQFSKISSTIFDKLTDVSFAVYSTKKDMWGFPIGSGIFKIENLNSTEIKLVRNNNHPDFKDGNIEKIAVKLLPKSKYSIQEIEKMDIDFFPLTQISDPSLKPQKFNRVIYPSHRITAIVLNIKNSDERNFLKSCINPVGLMTMPYLNNEITPYYSIIPSGIENYQPSDHRNSYI